MENQFTRLSLLFGEDALKEIQKKKLLIFGLGGVGGSATDALGRSGFIDITIVDNDSVNITNINRQLIASLDTIGSKKVDVMEKHLKSLNSDIKVTKLDLFYTPSCTSINFSDYDYVIDAIDTVSAKIDIIEKCHHANVPVISALGCGNRIDPSLLTVTDLSKTSNDPLAKVLRRELRIRGINHSKVVCSKELPLIKSDKKSGIGSSAFVPPTAGILIASEVFKDLINK